MSNIAALLRQYSQESTEATEEGSVDESMVGAEEVLVVTDETTTELEEAIEEIAETVNDKAEAESALDNVIEATESLESAIEMIRSARLKGQRVNGVAMQIWTQGVVDSMEARQIPTEIFAGLQEDYGDSFEADSYSDYSVEAEAKAEGIMTKLWNMIKAAFAAVRDWFTKFLAWFGKSTDALEKAGKKLTEAAKAKAGKKASVKKISGKGYAVLVKGNDVDAAAALDDVVSYISLVTQDSIRLYEACVGHANKIEVDGIAAKIVAEVKKTVTTAKAKGEKSFATGTYVVAEYEADEKTGKITSKIKVDLSKAKGVDEVTLPTLAEIGNIGESVRKNAIALRDLVTKAERSTGRNTNVNLPASLKGKALENARLSARAITGAMKVAQNTTSELVKQSLPIGKKAYSFGMVSLNYYK